MKGTLGNVSIVGQFLKKCKQRKERLKTERTEVEHKEHGEGHSEESRCHTTCGMLAGWKPALPSSRYS
jgi:hypothetical protein